MPVSILDAIKQGQWNFEPSRLNEEFSATNALPGSPGKLEVLAERIQKGLPLWHPEDRLDYEGCSPEDFPAPVE